MANTERLVALGIWAINQDTRKKLGLPSEWNQENWLTKQPSASACGTACCMAGKVALEDGGVPIVNSFDDTDAWANVRAGFTSGRVRLPSGDWDFVEDHARNALGLTDGQAARLFAGGNDVHTVVQLVKEFTGTDLSYLVVTV